MPRIDGLDVSTWQGDLDYPNIPTSVKFIGHQVGWTNRSGERDKNLTMVDDVYRRNVALTRQSGRWVFHYLVPVNRPWREQLDLFLKLVGPIGPGEGVMFDVEYQHVIDLGWPSIKAMMDECEQRIGRPVLHYGELFDQIDTGRPKWVAHYGRNPGSETERAEMQKRYAAAGGPIAVWQWAGATGRCPGVVGAVDCNEIIDEPLLRRTLGLGGSVASGFSHNSALVKTWLDNAILVSRDIIRPRGIVAHTYVNSSNLTWQGVRSSFQVPNATKAQYVDRDGGAYEMLPPDRKFAASWQGDRFVLNGVTYGHIPYETEDEIGTALGPYTPAQRESLIKAWVVDCEMWDIAAVVPRVGDWTASGIHYHSLHGLNTHHQTKPTSDPFGFNYYDSARGYWVRVVNPLTKTVGKTCPGADKIAQHADMVAEVRARVAGSGQTPIPTPVPEVDLPAYVKLATSEVYWQDGAVVVRVPGSDLPTSEQGGYQLRVVTPDYFKRRGVVAPLPNKADGTDPQKDWKPEEFAFVLPQVIPPTAGEIPPHTHPLPDHTHVAGGVAS